MTFSIQTGKQDPTLEYDVTDAATGAPMRVTVLAGVVGLVPERQGMRVYRRGQQDPGEPVGFYVPGMQPLPVGVDPVVVAEVSLAQIGIHGVEGMTIMTGVGNVATQVIADPQNPANRWVYLSFECHGGEPLVVRYRVTLYRTR